MDQKQLETTYILTQEMVNELTDYVMKGELYRQLLVKTPTGTKLPKMTLGALLENMQLLDWERAHLSAEQQRQLQAMQDRVAIVHNSLPKEWNTLLRHELKALLDSWKWYLDDLRNDPDARENYGNEAHIRTRIDVVQAALAGDPLAASERQELNKLDTQLRKQLHGAKYVGPTGQEAHYPSGNAWWLHGQPADGDD